MLNEIYLTSDARHLIFGLNDYQLDYCVCASGYSMKRQDHLSHGCSLTGFIQASMSKNSRTFQGLLKASPTVFKDLK